jgi:hypothetical protein
MIAGTQSSFSYVLWAMAGAAIVLVGLFVELFAEKENFNGVRSFRRWKIAKKWGGEIVVIIGVAFEMVVGGIYAFRECKNDPLNQPIDSISSQVDFIMRGTNPPFLPLGGRLAVGTPEMETNGTHTLFPIFISDFKWVTLTNSKTLWVVEYDEMPLTASFSGELVRDADKWTVFDLQVPFLAAGTEIISGKVVLKINSIMKTNVIPPQMIKSPKFFHEVYLKSPTEGVTVFGQ